MSWVFTEISLVSEVILVSVDNIYFNWEIQKIIKYPPYLFLRVKIVMNNKYTSQMHSKNMHTDLTNSTMIFVPNSFQYFDNMSQKNNVYCH